MAQRKVFKKEIEAVQSAAEPLDGFNYTRGIHSSKNLTNPSVHHTYKIVSYMDCDALILFSIAPLHCLNKYLVSQHIVQLEAWPLNLAR